jgi:hypothetical protein
MIDFSNLPVIKADDVDTGTVLIETQFATLSDIIHFFDNYEEMYVQGKIDAAALGNHAMKVRNKVYDSNNVLKEIRVTEAVETGIQNNDALAEYINNINCKMILALQPLYYFDKDKSIAFQDKYTNPRTTLWKMLFHKQKTSYAFGNLAAFALYDITGHRIWAGTSDMNTHGFCCGHWAAFVTNAEYMGFPDNTILNTPYTDPPRIAPVDLVIMFDGKIFKVCLLKKTI